MTIPSFKTFGQVLAAAALVTAGSNAFAANTLTLNTNPYSDIYQGGEFTANNSGLSLSTYSSLALLNLNNGDGLGFETFCVDIAEEFNPAGTYDFTLGADIINPNLSDSPLTLGSAWLYAEFATGGLAAYGYDYNLAGSGGDFSSRVSAAGALQSALWFLQNEGTIDNSPSGSYDATNPFEVAVANQFGGTILNPDANAEVAANGAYGVDVMVLTNSNGSLAQPQLYLDSPPSLPDSGATLALLGIALLGLAAFQRRITALKSTAL